MKNLKQLREQRSLTQLSLALSVDVQQETISAYENGKSMPTVDTLLKLAKYFNCSSDYLLDLTDIPTPVNDLVFDNLNATEADIVRTYRNLDRDNRNKVLGYIKALQR